MSCYVKQSKRSIGFGTSMIEATDDAYVNSCINDLSMDTNGLFIKRREEICPWMPKSNMLHLSGIGCLVYDKGYITETKTNKKVLVAATGDSIFYYLNELFGAQLSYSDIICTLREEIDTFFKNISKDFVSIADMPIIQVQQESASFQPLAIYTTKFDFVIGCSEQLIGVKWFGDDCYYTVSIDDSTQQITALYRILARCGYTIVDDELIELNEVVYHYS